ncbi:HTH_48 domain-containing protein [Trichonephila clavipes]|uniref:HTH_48 domain-containing protein n=1 Tax=Trichonephila clavipes TaxID=2585209 RepID=A0A8X6USK8_TRICX|nr:HTH_48 domain-containing protein [Trichonephila clavipes]
MKHEYSTSPRNQSNSRWNWRHTTSPVKVKDKQRLSKRKVMATMLWDRRGILLVDFMPQGTAIKSAYGSTLWKLRRVLQNKRCGMLSKGVLLLHDNAGPHTSRMTRDLIEYLVLDNAPYSLDLAPRDFHLFWYLKHNLDGVTLQ